MKFKRLLSCLLAFSLFSSSLAVNAVSGSSAGDGISTVEGKLSPGIYSFPISFYDGNKITVNPQEELSDQDWAIKKGALSTTAVYPQFNERAMVVAKENGTYEVKLQFHAYSKFSFLQVMNPTQLTAVKNYAKDSDLKFNQIPVSAANCSEEAESWLAASQPGWISDTDEVEGFYLPSAQVSLEQSAQYKDMDMGTVAFTVSDLTDPLVLQCGQQDYSTRYSLVGFLGQENAEKISEELLNGNSGEYRFQYAWSNYFNAVAGSYQKSSTRGKAVILQILNTLFSSEEVAVAPVGTEGVEYRAVFQRNPEFTLTNGTTVQIDSVKQAVQRGTAADKYYLLDQNGTTYSSDGLEITDSSLTLSFSTVEDLVFGSWLQITTTNAQQAITYYNGCLHAVPLPAEQEPKAGDVQVLGGTAALPENTQLTVVNAKTQEELALVNEEEFGSYSAIAVDDRYRFYNLSLTDNTGGKVSTLTKAVTLQFSIPESWDMERLFLFQWSSKNKNILSNYTIDENNRTVSIVTSDASYLNCDYLLAERANAMDLTPVLQKDGLYRVKLSILHSYLNKPSMASAAFVGNEGYLDVKDGKGRLYVEFQGIHISGLLGYLANFFYLDGGEIGEQSQSEHLQYHWNTDEGGMAEEYGLTYLQRASIPLTTPDKNGAYWVRFSVPIMDGLTNGGVPGDGSGAQPARLLIINAEKIDGTNPWAGYDKSILKAKISDAEKQLQNLDNSEKAALQAAIDEAQRTYDSSPDSDEVLSAVQALASAMGGTENPGGEEPDPDTKDLEQAIADAEEYEADEYEDTSFEALAAMIDAAKAAQDRNDLTEEQAQAQVNALEASVDALVSLGELEENEEAASSKVTLKKGETIPEGSYQLPVRLWKFAENKASMGDGALDKTAILEVAEDGTARAILKFSQLTATWSGQDFSSYLLYLKEVHNYNTSTMKYDTVDADVLKEYKDVTDAYGPPEGKYYPKELSIAVKPWEEYTNVEVFVPVMDSISAGSGTQLARIKLDWSALTGGSALALTDLNAQINTFATLDRNDYTEKSFAALNAGVVAARALKLESRAAQEMIDARTAALEAVMEALIRTDIGGGNDDPDNGNGGNSVSTAKASLKKWVRIAGLFSSGEYTSSSFAILSTALTQANTVLNNSKATVEQIEDAESDLMIAVAALKPKSSSSSSKSNSNLDYEDLDDGYYEVDVDLWHASMDKASMGDPSMGDTALIQVKKGKYTMRVTAEPMTVSGITAILQSLQVKQKSGSYKSAKIVKKSSKLRIFEFELPSTDEYIKVKVDPKVEVMGKDPVDARLKIDWDTIDEVDEDDWDSTKTSTTTSDDEEMPEAEIADAATGVKVTAAGGILPAGVTVKAQKVESGEPFTRTHNLLSGEASKFVLFDVTLLNSSTAVQPSGKVSLVLPIPAGFDTGKLVAYRINDDGSKTLMVGSVSSGSYVISTSHFSLYALAESIEQRAQAVMSPAVKPSSGETVTAANKGTTEYVPGSRENKNSGKTSGSKTAGSVTKSETAKQEENEALQKLALLQETNRAAAATVDTKVDGREIPYTGDRTPLGLIIGICIASAVLMAVLVIFQKKEGKRGAGR